VVFSPGKDGEAGDVCFIVDTAGCSQAEKEPLEARPSFPTEPKVFHDQKGHNGKSMKGRVFDFAVTDSEMQYPEPDPHICIG
jgi:hypothetical protein